MPPAAATSDAKAAGLLVCVGGPSIESDESDELDGERPTPPDVPGAAGDLAVEASLELAKREACWADEGKGEADIPSFLFLSFSSPLGDDIGCRD